jgi:hypothetical protein
LAVSHAATGSVGRPKADTYLLGLLILRGLVSISMMAVPLRCVERRLARVRA